MRALALDREFEAVTAARVLDGNGHRVLARVPEQDDADAVAFSSGKFPSVRCFGGHSSFRSSR